MKRLDEIEYLIHIKDEEIQAGILNNKDFQNTEKGKYLLKDLNMYLSIRDEIIEEIATAGDTDAILRHRPNSNNFTPCELGQCNCPHC